MKSLYREGVFYDDARKVKTHVTLRSKIGTEILVLAKSFQSGRVPDFGTNVPKNERDIKKAGKR